MGLTEALAAFECMGQCSPGALEVKEEVRAMCAADRCRSYGRNWACPPACGTLDEYRGLFGEYRRCSVVQTIGELEDAFDVEAMEASALLHSRRMEAVAAAVRAEEPGGLVLGAGACTRCLECSCPYAPCRFPGERLVSMEAAGLVVSEVCNAAGIPYNHGPMTITYTGCVLTERS